MTTTPSAYPLLCKPVLKPKIWGGRKLEKLFGMELPPGRKIGEAWIVADLAEGSSLVANGALAGQTLSEAARLWGESLIGPAWRGKPTAGRFPLLVKFLDAQDDLSIQVHPDETACKAFFPRDFSKDESWVVLDSEPGGSILHGFKDGVTLADFDRLLAEGNVVESMWCIEVKPGDLFRVAPGMAHALRKGVAILEIQEPSDSTFRIYDYGRTGEDGKPRPLHVDAARRVMCFGKDQPAPPRPVVSDVPWGLHTRMVDVAAYRIEKLQMRSEVSWTVDPRSAQALILLGGGLRLESGAGPLALKAGDAVILPATLGGVRTAPQGAEAEAVLAGAGGIPMVM
jgi:mannose-6-phosphate isomerase